MSEYKVKILQKDQLTHNVFRLRLERPAGYRFTAGQAIELALEPGGGKAPFTFTGLESDPFLELTFKSYPEHNGITKRMAELKTGDEIFITEAWDSYIYTAPGVFLAGGAGITPFLAILRKLRTENKVAGNRLFFSNHTAGDIILGEELRDLLGNDCVFLLSGEQKAGYHAGRIDEKFLRENIKNFNQPFYLCGPDPFVDDIRRHLVTLGADPKQIITSL